MTKLQVGPKNEDFDNRVLDCIRKNRTEMFCKYAKDFGILLNDLSLSESQRSTIVDKVVHWIFYTQLDCFNLGWNSSFDAIYEYCHSNIAKME